MGWCNICEGYTPGGFLCGDCTKRADRRRRRQVDRVDSFDDWEYESCDWCGRRNNVGWTVEDSVWMEVTKDPDIVLCPACFDVEAQKLGVTYKAKAMCFVTWSNENTENKGAV